MVAKKKKMRLGEILIERGIIDNSGLDRALEKQKQSGGLLGEVLLKMGLVKEEDIVIALASQFNIPYLPVQNCDINAKILKLVLPELAKKHLFIPIDRINDVLTVIMADPTNMYAREEIKQATGLRLQVLVGTVSEISTAIRKHYKIKDSLLVSDDPLKNIGDRSFHDAIQSEKSKDKKNNNEAL
jgi:type IV pilus assembly protein PilB